MVKQYLPKPKHWQMAQYEAAKFYIMIKQRYQLILILV